VTGHDRADGAAGSSASVVQPWRGEINRPTWGKDRKRRAAEIIAAARRLLDNGGRDALTMRRVADELGIQAPSLYKHYRSKAELELALLTDAMVEIGQASHEAVDAGGDGPALVRLLETYRCYGLSHPHLYRLATAGPWARGGLPPGLEEWAGHPWYAVTGDPSLAQALWSFAHGMVIMELDGRYPPGSDLAATWAAGAEAFDVMAAQGRALAREALAEDLHQ
jgi:AcrR family transcriptional regulator